MMSRSTIRSILLLAALTALCTTVQAQPVQFTRLTESIEGQTAEVSPREEARYERFLSAVFPATPMRRFAHTNEKPIVRRVTYTVVEQRRQRFIVAVFSGRWNDAYNVIGIYRVRQGPIQVWRSSPWEATYYDLHLTTADIGYRTLVLFQEGGEDGNFGLGSVFSFVNGRKGLWLRDITPMNSIVIARTRFPFRPILAQDIHLGSQDEGKATLMLSASDQEYLLASNERVRPTEHWLYDRSHNRFEKLGALREASTYRSAVR